MPHETVLPSLEYVVVRDQFESLILHWIEHSHPADCEECSRWVKIADLLMTPFSKKDFGTAKSSTAKPL